ncbi:hypothetical protein QP157_15460 [Sphingomonas sp. LR61]|uniref:hypothetical protein n=1 Tax=Sphingomonas sp. LR61 TaxID=3050234 RepID=UPI002FE01D9F
MLVHVVDRSPDPGVPRCPQGARRFGGLRWVQGEEGDGDGPGGVRPGGGGHTLRREDPTSGLEDLPPAHDGVRCGDSTLVEVQASGGQAVALLGDGPHERAGEVHHDGVVVAGLDDGASFGGHQRRHAVVDRPAAAQEIECDDAAEHQDDDVRVVGGHGAADVAAHLRPAERHVAVTDGQVPERVRPGGRTGLPGGARDEARQLLEGLFGRGRRGLQADRCGSGGGVRFGGGRG